MNNKIAYINVMMDRLNELMIELYEDMADGEDKKVVKLCEQIIDIVRQIKVDHNED